MAIINKKTFTLAAKGTNGVQARVAKKLGVSRNAVCRYVHKHPWAAELLREELENRFDMAEDAQDLILSIGRTKETKHLTYDSKMLALKEKVSRHVLSSPRAKSRGMGGSSEMQIDAGVSSINITFNKPEED